MSELAWKRERPTEAGMYWIYHALPPQVKIETRPMLADLVRIDDELWLIADFGDYKLTENDGPEPFYWLGPIQVPEPPKEACNG